MLGRKRRQVIITEDLDARIHVGCINNYAKIQKKLPIIF